MHLQADWAKTFDSLQELEEDIGGNLKLPYPQFEGWIETATDTMLISLHRRPSEKSDSYTVQCWNIPNARAVIAETLGRTVIRL